MPLDPKQEKLLNRFFPGLVAAVRALGAGDFAIKCPSIKPKGNGIRAVENLQASYTLTDGFALEMRVSLRVRDADKPYVPSDAPVDLHLWERTYYCLGYGKAQSDHCFRFDLDALSGRHVHMQPNMKAHVPAAQADPDTSDLDPRDFVAMVRAYRESGAYPVKPRKP
jgi:hypothetical protein